MNKVSGKLAAGVRKVKTQQKTETAAAPAAAAPAVPKRMQAKAQPGSAAALHPDRIWPD